MHYWEAQSGPCAALMSHGNRGGQLATVRLSSEIARLGIPQHKERRSREAQGEHDSGAHRQGIGPRDHLHVARDDKQDHSDGTFDLGKTMLWNSIEVSVSVERDGITGVLVTGDLVGDPAAVRVGQVVAGDVGEVVVVDFTISEAVGVGGSEMAAALDISVGAVSEEANMMLSMTQIAILAIKQSEQNLHWDSSGLDLLDRNGKLPGIVYLHPRR